MTIEGEVPSVRVREATRADLPAVRELIAAAGLPLDGLHDACHVLVADADGLVVGTVALEQHGSGRDTALLLRSVAVHPSWRDRGIGAALIASALTPVDRAGADVALLTETAGDWFPRFGFIPVERTSLPRVLESSEELRGACPASAQAMLRTAGSATQPPAGTAVSADPTGD
jgi:amino-acid N-acetyltransferase